MPTKFPAAILGSGPSARRKWTTGAVAATSATAFTQITAWKGKTLSTGGGFDMDLAGVKKLDRIDISGAANSLGLGASVQTVRMHDAVDESTLLGVAYGGQKVTEGLAGTPPIQIPTSMALRSLKLDMEAGAGPIDIGEFMSIVAVRQSDEAPTVSMKYRAAVLSSATKDADLPLVGVSGKTTYPFSPDHSKTQGVRQAWVSAAQDALALGAVAFGIEADGEALADNRPYRLVGPAGGGQLVTSHHYGVSPVISDEWIDMSGGGDVELNGVAAAGTGVALSVCAVGACLGFQMSPA